MKLKSVQKPDPMNFIEHLKMKKCDGYKQQLWKIRFSDCILINHSSLQGDIVIVYDYFKNIAIVVLDQPVKTSTLLTRSCNCLSCIDRLKRVLSDVIAFNWPALILRCSEPASCRDIFHCTLADKLCPTAMSPLPSVPVKTYIARYAKTKHLCSQSACGRMDVEVGYQWWSWEVGASTELDLNIFLLLFVEWPGRLTWEDWMFSRKGGEYERGSSRASSRDCDV